MLLSNWIARFFDHQYLWNKSIYILDFLHGDELLATETITWLGVARCAQTCPSIPRCARVLLIGLGGIARLEIVPNEGLSNF